MKLIFWPKETAVDRIVSPKRMKQKLAQASQEQPRMSYSRQEETILREAKAKSSLQFLAEIKKARNATITQSERKTLSKLADLGLLDEVINIILLLTFNKTQSANLNEKYALKVGNDFFLSRRQQCRTGSFKKFENARNKLKLKETRGRVLHQPRASTAMFPSGVNQIIKIKPAKQKRWILLKRNNAC